MGVVIKLVMLLVGTAATIIALTGDATDDDKSQQKSSFPTFNMRGKISLGLLAAALLLGVWDLFLSESAEQDKVDQIIANGEKLQETTDQLSTIHTDLKQVGASQTTVLGAMKETEKKLDATQQKQSENLADTKKTLESAASIEKQLLRLPRVLTSSEVSINEPVSPSSGMELSIESGNILRYTIASPNAISRQELLDWNIKVQLGNKQFPVTELTGEIIAGGKEGEKQKVLIRHPSVIEASLVYTIYEL